MKTRYMLLLMLAVIAFTGCKKKSGESPTVETYMPRFYASKTATLGCRVTSNGGQPLLAAGVYIGTSSSPDMNGGAKLQMGSDTGLFIGQISGLTPATTYYVKAYAINVNGESLGIEAYFMTPALTQDNDGNQCETAIIADQIWMVTNLKSTHYRNGDLIPTTTPVNLDISGETSPLYMWFANGDYATSQTYGLLYTWYAITDSRNICPTGWHVPTDADWTKLEDNLGGILIAGSSLKEYGTSHWLAPYNADATNISCFTALPAGYRVAAGSFALLQNEAHFWTSTETQPAKAYERSLSASSFSAGRLESFKNSGLSVRCIKD